MSDSAFFLLLCRHVPLCLLCACDLSKQLKMSISFTFILHSNKLNYRHGQNYRAMLIGHAPPISPIYMYSILEGKTVLFLRDSLFSRCFQ